MRFPASVVLIATASVLAVTGSVRAQQTEPRQPAADRSPIQRMAATERAFAAATAELGFRDGFLAFFADDAILLNAGTDGATATTTSAKDGLRALPLAPLPLAEQLIWAPYTGHVSADGTMGWLTGGYARVHTATRDVLDRGAYFSVWTQQSDGTWKVWLDEGVSLPRAWEATGPFRVAPEPDTGDVGAPTETVDAAERSVSGGGDAWRARLASSVRLHRHGVMPLVGREEASDWATKNWQRIRYTAIQHRAAQSGDLGAALGGYDATTAAGAAEHGTWVRIWKRDVTGRWRIVFETSKPARR